MKDLVQYTGPGGRFFESQERAIQSMLVWQRLFAVSNPIRGRPKPEPATNNGNNNNSNNHNHNSNNNNDDNDMQQ